MRFQPLFPLLILFIVLQTLSEPSSLASAQGLQAEKSSASAKITDWFKRYDLIRKEAQMSEAERANSKRLLTQGVAASLVGQQSAQDKAAAKALLKRMVDRYDQASSGINALKPPSQTARLQKGYVNYFATAEALFSDYIKVQDSLFATDAKGAPILGQLQQRKLALEELDVENKALDERLRSNFGIAPYAY